MQTFQALGALLTYPTEDLIAALPEIRNILRAEELLGNADLESLVPVMQSLETTPLLDQQEAYVGVFDRNPGLALHLFEHVYGESRDRGQALAELADLYASNGMFLKEGELPDYLPAFLEFMGKQPEKEARRLLGEVGHILQLLANRLAQRENAYAPLMAVITSLCEPHPEAARLAETDKKNPDREPDLEAVWQEPEAFPTQTCGTTQPTAQITKPTRITIEEPSHG